MEASEQPSTPPAVTDTVGGRITLIITNAGKILGLVFGTIEAIGPARPPAILFWVALFLGAQASEEILSKLIRQLTTGK